MCIVQQSFKSPPKLALYVASFIDTAQAFAERIRGYWGVENKVHYVRDVTQSEDASRIRTSPLIQIWALARNERTQLVSQ
jgi:predicted transposase YbfD/YdcC